MKQILVIDDEQSTQISIRMVLKDEYEVHNAYSTKEAQEILAKQNIDLILLDIIMPDEDGMKYLARVRRSNPQIPVIMITATKTIRTAVEAIKLGAVEYLTKPFDVKELQSCVKIALRTREATSTHEKRTPTQQAPIIYTSTAMTRLMDAVKMVAPEECTIYIHGESGTGKELIAHEIHRLSPRRHHPFVAVNCAAIPDTLIENELFGHEQGAYTNAQRSSPGKVDLARGGTLFFDEVGDLSLEGQAKLLRMIQDKTFMRVGGLEQIPINARFIFATNKNLEEEINTGKFRRDLFYRINVIPLNIPPLKDRRDDIQVLLRYYLEQTLQAQNKPLKTFSAEALNFLMTYNWPGNVRELKNQVEYLVSLTQNEIIDWQDLPLKIRANQRYVAPTNSDQKHHSLQQMEDELQRQMIVTALEKTDFVQTKAAELLGTTRRILKYRMDKYGILVKSDAEN